MSDASRGMVLQGRRLAPAQRPDDAGQEHREGVAAGIHHPGVAEHREEVRAALDRFLTGFERPRYHLGDHGVLLGGARLGPQPRVAHVGQLGGNADGHLAHDRQDRALSGVSHGSVGLIGRARQRRADQRRINQLTRPAGELLRGASDQLREDHARVPTCTQQRRARHRGDDLVTADVVDRAILGRGRQTIELLQDRAQGQHHVVAGIPVGNREYVEIVDLLAAGLQRRQASLDQGAKTDDAGIGHGRRSVLSRRSGHASQRALATLPAFKHRVQT